MNPEDIMSSGISQTQKDKCQIIHFCELLRVAKVRGTGGGGGGRGGGVGGQGREGYCLMGREFSA